MVHGADPDWLLWLPPYPLASRSLDPRTSRSAYSYSALCYYHSVFTYTVSDADGPPPPPRGRRPRGPRGYTHKGGDTQARPDVRSQKPDHPCAPNSKLQNHVNALNPPQPHPSGLAGRAQPSPAHEHDRTLIHSDDYINALFRCLTVRKHAHSITHKEDLHHPSSDTHSHTRTRTHTTHVYTCTVRVRDYVCVARSRHLTPRSLDTRITREPPLHKVGHARWHRGALVRLCPFTCAQRAGCRHPT